MSTPPPPTLHKYPRTRHVTGSRLQPGDEDLTQVRLSDVAGRHAVIEEKLDGANGGLSVPPGYRLTLQSRGHFLSGGGLGESQFGIIKGWADAHRRWIEELLGSRYVLYFEALSKKHTVWYDMLPHYAHEFDVLDTETGEFLSTARRRELLAGRPVVSAPVIYEGPMPATVSQLEEMIGRPLYQSVDWRETLREECARRRLDYGRVLAQTDKAGLAEGLYIKIEEDGRVVERLKFVRAGFLQTVFAAGTHVNDYPDLPNRLAPGTDIYSC